MRIEEDMQCKTFNSTHVAFKSRVKKPPPLIRDELEDLMASTNKPITLDDLSNLRLATVPRNATSTLRG